MWIAIILALRHSSGNVADSKDVTNFLCSYYFMFNYFDRWIKMTDTPEMCGGGRDCMIREQFLCLLPPEAMHVS